MHFEGICSLKTELNYPFNISINTLKLCLSRDFFTTFFVYIGHSAAVYLVSVLYF